MSTTVAGHAVTRVSPMLAVADMEETLLFYQRVLQFEVCKQTPGYSIIERDGATIHFMKAADPSVMDAVRGHAEIYIEVENIGALWEHVRNFKDTYRIRDLFDQPYGMTEFHIGDPNGCLVFVGQPTENHSSHEQTANS